MIFNEVTYYLLFLLPSVAAFHLVSRVGINVLAARAWVLSTFGILFFAYYGYVHFGGWKGAAAVGLFVWELATSQLYRPRSRWCVFGIVQAVLILVWFKYAGFFALAWNDLAPERGLRIAHVPGPWLPLGISFFTFEFIHFAVDTYQGKIERRPY